MKKYFLIFMVFLGSCIKPETPPSDLISKDSMTHMLIDIHIAEAKVASKGLYPDSANMYYDAHKKDIYKKYKVSDKRFQTSYDYYMRNVEQMDKIYEVVIDSLGLMEGRGRLE